MGTSFGLALILVVFAGAELYTGHTMTMTVATLDGRTTLRDLAAVWLTSWAGNLAGALLLAALFVAAGGGLDRQRAERVPLQGRGGQDECAGPATRLPRHPVQLASLPGALDVGADHRANPAA